MDQKRINNCIVIDSQTHTSMDTCMTKMYLLIIYNKDMEYKHMKLTRCV